MGSSSSSSTSATPSAVTRSISVVSTSGVSSTVCSASISFCLRQLSLLAADGEHRFEVELGTPGGSAPLAIDVTDASGGDTVSDETSEGDEVESLSDDVRDVSETCCTSRPSSSITIADSSLTLARSKSIIPSIPLGQPTYQPVGGIASGARIVELCPASGVLVRSRPSTPRVAAGPRLDLDLGQGAPRRRVQEHGHHGVDRVPQLGITRQGLLDYDASQ